MGQPIRFAAARICASKWDVRNSFRDLHRFEHQWAIHRGHRNCHPCLHPSPRFRTSERLWLSRRCARTDELRRHLRRPRPILRLHEPARDSRLVPLRRIGAHRAEQDVRIEESISRGVAARRGSSAHPRRAPPSAAASSPENCFKACFSFRSDMGTSEFRGCKSLSVNCSSIATPSSPAGHTH